MTFPTQSQWVKPRDAADALGVSERTLLRWRSAGFLKPGTHWRRKFPSPNSHVLYDLAAVESVMREVTPNFADLLEQEAT